MSTTQLRYDAFHNIINGKPRDAAEKTYGINPSTGERLWPVPKATQQDLEDAVQSAKTAFQTFSREPLEKRKERLVKFRDLLMAHADEMTDLLGVEGGKPFESKGVRTWFDHHLSLNIPEERFEDEEKVVTTQYTPLGVVGAICPWNYPLLLSLAKVIPAVLTGNTVIVKPSPYTPYTALRCTELAQEVFPPGVVQAIAGDETLGPLMTAHPDIAKISFTGSVATGKRVMAACAQTLKRFTLELGGNDPSIVLPDVDVKQTAQRLVLGALQNSGQMCVATKRIYVHEQIYDEMLSEMVNFAQSLTVGGPATGSFLGPIQNAMQYEKVKDIIADSHEKGYRFATGITPDAQVEKGFFIRPTIIDNPPNDSRIIQEEPFGPIVPTQPWSDEDEVIKRANDTNMGLGACVWSKDVAHAERIAKRLDAGSIWINSFAKPIAEAFFGGHKESGVGGEWGQLGLLNYCNARAIHSYK